MKKLSLLLFLFIPGLSASAQNKKPLDHSVYDGWKSVGERMISNDGKFIVYTIVPQEGDGELVIQNPQTNYKKTVARGYNAVITEDSRFVIFKIKPFFQDTRQAKIKKKKADDMPKDSLGVIELGKDSILKIARVKSYKSPEKGAGWLAYQLEKPLPDTAKKKIVIDSVKLKIDSLVHLADSVIRKSIDSVKGKISKEEVITEAQKAAKAILKNADEINDVNDRLQDAGADDASANTGSDGTDLIVRRTDDTTHKLFKLVSDYYFDKKGDKLLLSITKSSKDSNSKAYLLLYDLKLLKVDTVMKGFNDSKNFAFDEDGNQLAFLAERDSSDKALQKFYKLWYYTNGQDSARILVSKKTDGMKTGYTVSEDGAVNFSKDGKKLFFGTAAIKPPKDTTLVDFELARLDIWNYKDDYIQPQQLKELDAELKRNYTAVIKPGDTSFVQLGAEDAENIALINQGNADYVLATSTKGNRIESQWTGRLKQTAYIISTVDGSRKLVTKNIATPISASPQGKYIYWYNLLSRNYFTYEVATGIIKNVTEKIKEPLYDIENDVPDYPEPRGTTGWTAGDSSFLVNDYYDVWQVQPNGNGQPKNITNGYGKKTKTIFTYVQLDPEKRFFKNDDTILLRLFNKTTKNAGFYTIKLNQTNSLDSFVTGAYIFSNPIKAKKAEQYILQRANSQQSELYTTSDIKNLIRLTDIASQQKQYNWVTSELIRWKMLDGKMSEGILYKPENFDPNKKYPIIFYFYERDADMLNYYRPPAPSASIINITYFCSNGYLVFDPNIYYKTGEPGQSAYNSVVSAAKYFSKKPWVDSTRMALDGQSWGGYEVAYLVSHTNIFHAAFAGAPVANMTSAYGGIRWETGINREFQYEKTQSRIGATLWQRPDLYIKNSALFSADKINTPLLIMQNDADGAVPWYQGIEFFTALKRLGKKAWMLEYNGEAHNLLERKNRKDLSIRLSQFFDYYLKDGKQAKWMKDGVPATQKGIDWGLETE